MITPKFEISQDHYFLTIKIEARCTVINGESHTEIHVEENEFLFHSTPYFLRLTFSNKLSHNNEKVLYQDDIFTVKVRKYNPGELFEDLDMLSNSNSKHVHSPQIKVIGEEKKDELNCYTERAVINGDDQDDVTVTSKYGFANMKHEILSRLGGEIDEAIDLKNPDQVNEANRKKERILNENKSFDDSHYLADYHEDECIQELIEFEPFWYNIGEDRGDNDGLDETQKEILFKLPQQNFHLSSKNNQKNSVNLSLIDILFAFAYDVRTTSGLHSVESGWTICKLSATLSWLDKFSDISEVVVALLRRSLCFPLYRHWKLSLVVIKDVLHILKRGKKFVLKCLLQIRELLVDGYNHYILNELYIDDYCVWIQHIKGSKLTELAQSLEEVQVLKSDLGFDIEILEQISEEGLEESGGSKINQVIIHEDDDSEEEDDDEEEEDDNDTEEDGDDDIDKDDHKAKHNTHELSESSEVESQISRLKIDSK